MANFDPETGRLELVLPLPPTDNNCHASTGKVKYPTPGYKEWLRTAAPLLREVLGDWQPDRERWWHILVTYQLGSRGDAQNYLKPLLDLLTGAHVIPRTVRDAGGSIIATAGSIKKPGGLWDDDCRIGALSFRVAWVRHETPCLTLQVEPLLSRPCDWKADQEAYRRHEREATRLQARQEREAAKDAEKARKAAERAARKPQTSPRARRRPEDLVLIP